MENKTQINDLITQRAYLNRTSLLPQPTEDELCTIKEFLNLPMVSFWNFQKSNFLAHSLIYQIRQLRVLFLLRKKLIGFKEAHDSLTKANGYGIMHAQTVTNPSELNLNGRLFALPATRMLTFFQGNHHNSNFTNYFNKHCFTNYQQQLQE